MEDWEMEKRLDLKERLLLFSVNILNFLKVLPKSKEYDVLRNQLSKSATSIGANYMEAQSSSLKEFVQKSRIALRESHETFYWLQIIDKLQLGNYEQRKFLLDEISQISKIFGAIVSKTNKRLIE
jgi:four helix bundle protein